MSTSPAAGARRLLSTPDAAAFLGRAQVTLRKWRVAGFGPPFRVMNGRCFYELEDLEAFVARHPRRHSTSAHTITREVAA